MNRRGQAIVEAVLILLLLMAVTTFVSSQFKQNELMAKMVSGPWLRLAGMIQNGQWRPVNQSNGLHPTKQYRHISTKGDPIQ